MLTSVLIVESASGFYYDGYFALIYSNIKATWPSPVLLSQSCTIPYQPRALCDMINKTFISPTKPLPGSLDTPWR